MTDNKALERGRLAGDILLAQVLIRIALLVASDLIKGTFYDIGYAFIGGAISIALSFILINPLRKDRFDRLRNVYVFLGCLSLLGLYFTFTEESFAAGIVGSLDISVTVLVIIGLYNPGKAGKICCWFAAGVSAVSVLLSFAVAELTFPDFVSSVFSVAYLVYLGLYIESKGVRTEEYATATEPPVKPFDEQPNSSGNNYDDLIKLKELMDAGIITPAEYEAKKKQILGL